MTDKFILTCGYDDLAFKNSMYFRGTEMMRLFILLFGVLLILSGCIGTSHYYKVDDDNIHVYLNNPDAEKVLFFSSLDQFQPHEALKDNKGVWETIVPSGMEMKYFYIVDGNVFTPECDQMGMDDLGGKNCIYIPGQ